MVFGDYGFETGKVLLPGLNLIVKLNRNRYFRNDGIVENMDEHLDDVKRELGISNFDYTRGVPSMGRHIKLSYGSDKISIIFIKDQSSETNRFNYGHESTHAIIYLGLEDYFMDMLRKEGFTLNPFKRYNNEDDIANVGGLVSVYKTDQFNLNYKLVNHPELSPILEELMKSKR